MGSCNCGHLAQTITRLDRHELHAMALRRAGDWTDQSRIEFCPRSGYPLDYVIESMMQLGMTVRDIEQLEKLSNRDVLRRLPVAERNLRHNHREDVVRYMREWAGLLEDSRADFVSDSAAYEQRPVAAIAHSSY